MDEHQQSVLRFCRVLMPGFSEKLPLPRDFSKRIGCTGSDECTGTAVFVSPNGKSWHVDIYNENDAAYMGGEGWKLLVLANNLRLGYFLVLTYKGNMMFNFRAFDLSTFEVAYPSVAKKHKEKKIIVEISDDENPDIVKEAAGPPLKKQKHAKIVADIIQEAGKPSYKKQKNRDIIHEAAEPSHKYQKSAKIIPGIIQEEAKPSHKNRKSKGIIQEVAEPSRKKQKSAKIVPDIIQESAKPPYIEKERKDTIQEETGPSCGKQKGKGISEAWDKKGPSRHRRHTSEMRFVVTIEESNLSRRRRRCFLRIPTEFVDSCGIFGSRLRLVDPKDIVWQIGLFHSSYPAIYISKGWMAFAHANELEVGDQCIFELLPRCEGQVTMSVKILKSCEPVGEAHFKVDITDYNLRKNFLCIPQEFSEWGMPRECSGLKLRNQKGQTWEVGVYSRIRTLCRRTEFSIGNGWLAFAHGNQLERGDRCIFRIASQGKKEMVMEVQVLKAPHKANE